MRVLLLGLELGAKYAARDTGCAPGSTPTSVPRVPTGPCLNRLTSGSWKLAKHRFEVSLSEVAAVFYFLFSLQFCHTHVYMTPGPLSSEHIFEKEKSGSGSHHPS